MSYRLYEGEPITRGIKRIAYEQIDDALDHLEDIDDDLNDAVHETRKCLKKLRGLLRLVRKEIGEEVYQRENVCFRDAGRLLSDMRDSKVMRNVFDDIIDDLNDGSYKKIRKGLKSDYKATRKRVIYEDQAHQKVAVMLKAARLRVEDWPVETESYEGIEGGLRKVYKRGRNRLEDAEEDSTAEAFHEWRKRVKYLWYNIRILQPIWPDLMDVLADEIHDLSDYLGDEHDLAEFRDLILERPIHFPDKTTRMKILSHIEESRSTLQKKAFTQGKRIYAEKPDKFIDRIGTYWEVIPA